MKKWITERLLYLDSKFGYEMHTKESITVRANKKGRVEFKIKTYSPMYIKVKWRNGDGGVVSQKVGRNETVTFASDLPTETDQEILVYGAKHLKEIGDISNMKPSSLSLGDATRLTKLICTNSPNLQALGLGGTTKAVNSLKNLQLIDLTGCSKLGTVTSSSGLDVSYYDNLKTLKLHGTNLQSITFNEKGGNLEEMYLPNSLTSLYLANQYNLRKVEFPGHNNADRLSHKHAYDLGSQISSLTIINCPNLVNLGLNRDVYSLILDHVVNYRGVALKNNPDDFDISKEDYKQAFTLSSFGRLEKVKIENSLLKYKYYNINASPSLTNVSFTGMPNLKGLILTGNRTYGCTGGNRNDNLERTPMFENINVNRCDNFDTLIIQRGNNWNNGFAYKFKENFEWDLSNLPLKRFICNMALQNLKKIILPGTIEEFSHSNTVTNNHGNSWNAQDGSSAGYDAKMSPLETIVVKGHYKEGFKGIDLADIPLNNVNLNGLVEKVEIIKDVDCKAIDLNPRMSQGKILENIKINFNNYKLNSLNSTFYGTDMANFTVTLDEPLATEKMDYSYMFQSAKNVEWENIKDFITKLPPGKVYKTFDGCEADRLEVGNMIGSATTDMSNCFYNMPRVTHIDLSNANTENVTTFYRMFGYSTKLRTILGLNELNTKKVTTYHSVFTRTGIERLDVSSWNIQNGYDDFASYCPNINYCKIKAKGSLWTMLHMSNTDISEVLFVNDRPTEVQFNNYTLPCLSDGTVDCNITLTNVIIAGCEGSAGLSRRNLTMDSLLSILNSLKDYSDQSGKTLYIGSKNLTKLDSHPEYIRIAHNKNWTLA